MTRISEDGQGSQKDNKTKGVEMSKAVVTLPDLQIKAHTRGSSSKPQKGYGGTDESFMSVNNRSAASSRNSGNMFKTAGTKNNRAHSSVQNRAGNMTSRYRKGTIPTQNIKFSQFLEILFTSGMNKAEIQMETQGYVQVLETNYTDKIRECKVDLEKMQRLLA